MRLLRKERINMKKCIIFGCGRFGNASYLKLKKIYEIIAWSDNNSQLWGTEKEGIKIISPCEMLPLMENKEVDVVIAMKLYDEVRVQLQHMGIKRIIIWKGGFFYRWEQGREMSPLKDCNYSFYIKSNSDKQKRHILFVQETACIRTHKIAKALRNYGYDVSLAYLVMPPSMQANAEYSEIYSDIYPIYSMQQLVDFVDGSDFDFIHSSNEPDVLTMILNQSNKPIIHDCHDLSSAYKSMTPEEMLIEFNANRNSCGIIYTTEGIRQETVRKFNIPEGKTFVLENLISEELKPEKKLQKLSKSDQELHCVYEGGIVQGDRESHRHFEDIWMKLAESGVHVHFYTNCKSEYCLYLEGLHEKIHYEGNYSSKQLAVEMTKYDVGLCILNVTVQNKQYLEFASPNKIQEYLNAGIPVAVGNIASQRKFVEDNGVGRQIDLAGDIRQQLLEIASIPIEDNFLREKGYTMESRIPQLVAFYNKCIKDRLSS